MFSALKRHWYERRIRQLISTAVVALYTENFDLSSLLDRLTKESDSLHLLRAFAAVRVAAGLTEPLSDADVADTVRHLQALEPHVSRPDFGEALELNRELAELHWLRRHGLILKGKLANQENEHSYEGSVYQFENDNKGPIACEEREKLRTLCAKINDLDRQIEVEELKAWKDQDNEEYERFKDELEARSLRDEVDTQDSVEGEMEFEAIVALLKNKIEDLLRAWNTGKR